MTLETRIAGVALSAAGSLDTKGLRGILLQLTNLAVNEGLIDRVGADTLLSLEGDLEELIIEVKLLQEIMGDGDEPLTDVEVRGILDPWRERFSWDLQRAFERKISEARYGPDQPSNLIFFRAA